MLEQSIEVLSSLSDEHYIRKHPDTLNSVGQHIRHIIDHYSALQDGVGKNEVSVSRTGDKVVHDLVDYDKRNRHCDIEFNRSVGIAEISKIISWLKSSFHQDKILNINAEVSINTQRSVRLKSSFSRELYHLMNHTLHHLAYIALLVKLEGIEVPGSTGVAPATATWRRQRNGASVVQMN